MASSEYIVKALGEKGVSISVIGAHNPHVVIASGDDGRLYIVTIEGPTVTLHSMDRRYALDYLSCLTRAVHGEGSEIKSKG